MDKLYKELLKIMTPYGKNIRTDSLWDDLTTTINKAFNNPQFIYGVYQKGNATIDFNNRNYDTKLEHFLGIDEISNNVRKPLLNKWTKENVGLIKNVSKDQVTRIKQIFDTAVAEGTSNKEIHKILKEEFGWSDHRIRLITDDQIGKLNGKLDQIKQEEAGIDSYYWNSVGDQSVRSQDQDQDGQLYKWNDPPEGGHPGQKVRCRCTATPNLDEILGKDTLKELGLEVDNRKAPWLIKEEKAWAAKKKRITKPKKKGK